MSELNQHDLAPDYSPQEYAPLAKLEQGHIDIWLRHRNELLKAKSRDTARECEASKLVSLGVMGTAAVLSANPLMWIPLAIGAVGYLWTAFQEYQDIGSVRPLPLYRGKIGDLLCLFEGRPVASRKAIQDDIEYLSNEEKSEALLLNYMFLELSELLAAAPARVRFDLYRHIVTQYYARMDLVSLEEVDAYLALAVGEERKSSQPSALTQSPAAELPSAAIEMTEGTIEEPILETPPTLPPTVPPTPEPSPALDTTESKNQDVPKAVPSIELHEDPAYTTEALIKLTLSPLSKIFGAVPGSGKTTMQRALIQELFHQYPDARVYVTQTKFDSFLGLETIPGAVLFSKPRRDGGSPILRQADRVSRILEYRSSFPQAQAKKMFKDKPVVLLICDYTDANKQIDSEVKIELQKIINQILCNGRAPNVQVWLDVQVLNQLAGLGLEGSDSRSAAILLTLGAERIEEGGDFGVVENAVFGNSDVFPSGFKARVKPCLDAFKQRSREANRTLVITHYADIGAFLLPDLSHLEQEVLSAQLLQRISQNMLEQDAQLNQLLTTEAKHLEQLFGSDDNSPDSESLTQEQQVVLEIIKAATKYPISFEAIRKSRKWGNNSPDKASLVSVLESLSPKWVRGTLDDGYYLQS